MSISNNLFHSAQAKVCAAHKTQAQHKMKYSSLFNVPEGQEE